MNRQRLIFGTVVVALCLLVTWIARNTYWEEITVPTLPRGEAATNPFYAAQRLSEELGATSEWRRALGELPSTESVMFLTHWNWDLIDNRREALEQWVEAGGRLILDGTLAAGGDSLETWSGLRIEEPGASEPAEIEETTQEEDEQAEAEPFWTEGACGELTLAVGESQTNPDRDRYEVCGLQYTGSVAYSRKAQWALEDDDGAQVVRVQLGKGTVTLINGSPLGNRELLEVQNPHLFVDAIALHRGDHVVFVSEEKRASLLQLIWLYGSPAVLLALALIAVALWRNSTRFGPLEASPDPSRRSLAEQIRGTGQFALRVGGGKALHAAMVRALHEAAGRRIPNYASLGRDDQVAAIAHLSAVDADQLAETMNFRGRQRPHEFKNAMALLETARTKVLAHDSRSKQPPRSQSSVAAPGEETRIPFG